MMQHVTSDRQKSTKSEGWKGCEMGKIVTKVWATKGLT